MSEHPQADEHLTELLSLQLYIYSSLAQSVEHLTVNQGVVGSSPTLGAILIGQKCNLCQKALFLQGFFGFLGQYF